MSMREHIVQPKGWIAKDRDYILFEYRHFISNTANIMKMVADSLPGHSPEVVKLYQKVAAYLESTLDKPKPELLLTDLKEEARTLAWKHMRSNQTDASTAILLWLDTIDSFYLAYSKQLHPEQKVTR